jgi:succinyl-diaminopimelate desuccinylase
VRSETVVTRVLDAVDRLRDEIVDFTCDLVRVPTVNPPGEAYEPCARLLGERLRGFGFDVTYLEATDRPEHTRQHPRVNVVGRRSGTRARPVIHLNGHTDVVPPGLGWTVDPFGGVVRGRRIYGRGSSDMKAGLAAAVYATEALRRSGVDLPATLEVSGTVDEESGGLAGMGWLAARRDVHVDRTDYVIIPEPFGSERIAIGHRGVYWFEVETKGQTAHGSMPFLGHSAIAQMGVILEAVRTELAPALQRRWSEMPVVPREARRPTINVNALHGGQRQDVIQTPCVADTCWAIFDRRFLVEESFEDVRREIIDLLARAASRVPGVRYEVRDGMVVAPVWTPGDSPLIGVLRRAIREVLGREAELVASPGTYDHKHVMRLGGIEHCVAYGPGRLDLAHQPDEWCGIGDLVRATKVLALALLRLAEVRPAR